MKIHNGVVFLDKVQTFFPTMNSMEYTDVGGNRIIIPMSVLIHLYGGAKYHIEKIYGIDFNEFSDDVMNPNHEFNG